jgi:hypothetical protein
MENRIVVEAPVEGVFTRLGLLFRKFGDIYDPVVEFDLQAALQDIREACVAEDLPELEVDVLDAMADDMVAHANANYRAVIMTADYPKVT